MRLITLAIHTYDRAIAVKTLLEAEGIPVTLQNVNLEQPEVSSGVRVRIHEHNLPLALRIVENPEIFGGASSHRHFAPSHRSILVPVDFSTHSVAAARAAVRLAAARKVDIAFLHSYIDPRLSGTGQLTDSLTFDLTENEATEHLVTTANGNMSRFADALKQEMKTGSLPMVRFSTSVVEGVPEEAIVACAKTVSPYLVVMGTRSSSRKERELIGSVAAEVLDTGRFSVLTIPEGVEVDNRTAPANILFFSNLDQEDIVAMDTLYRYLPNAHSSVTIVHVPARNRFVDRSAGKSAIALGDYCRKTFNHFTFRTIPVSPDDAVHELERLQQKYNFDLLVVPNRRKNALWRLFSPGLAHKILFQADIPMLVIPV